MRAEVRDLNHRSLSSTHSHTPHTSQTTHHTPHTHPHAYHTHTAHYSDLSPRYTRDKHLHSR
ncbi:hypothetical protein E2C01_088435 [Portunus trituberculatus]|uniref:Uncharacterized protein n=1 Tax=Portunus trituberculatus TaxID=210409 RepID=A0A5B7J662_PORTR|nr:hypothetical protein [Portunus trituberculatus]